MKLNTVLYFLVSLAVSAGALPYWIFYDNGGGDQLWSNAQNWDPDGVPDAVNQGYSVGLAAAQPELIIDGVGGYAECKNFISGVWGAQNDAQLQSGVYFYIVESCRLGYAGGPCTFTNNGGECYIGGSLFVGGGDQSTGNGVLIHNAGNTTVGWRLLVGPDSGISGTVGEVYLYDGTITSEVIEVNTGGVIDIYGGTLIFGGGSEAVLLGWVNQAQADGRLRAYGGAGNLVTSFDSQLNKLAVTANNDGPEPLPPREPNPSGLNQIGPDVELRWTGEAGYTYDLFLGTEMAAVGDGAVPAVSGLTQEQYSASGLEPGLYYWRVEETKGAMILSGPVWTFIVGDCRIIEDAESFSNGAELSGIWTPNMNAQIDIEGDKAHWGNRCVRFDYTDSNSLASAWMVREYPQVQDWSADGLSLELWYLGQTGNSLNPMYVAIEDAAGQVSIAVHPSSDAVCSVTWQSSKISLESFAGIDRGAVKKVYLGVGSHLQGINPGTGTIFVDDIRVCPATCIPAQYRYPDLDGDNEISLGDITILADAWIESGELGEALPANVTDDCRVDLEDYSVIAGQWTDSRKAIFIDQPGVKGLTNNLVELRFDASTGAMTGLKNMVTGDEYLKTTGGGGNPFRCYVNTTQVPPTLLQGYPYVIQSVENSMGGIIVDPKNCTLENATFSRQADAGVLSLVLAHAGLNLRFALEVRLGDGDTAPEMSLNVTNTGGASRNVMTAFPYFTGLGLGTDRNTNLGVRLRDFGQSRAPAWSQQGGLYGRGWNGQWNAVYEPSLNEVFGLIVKDPDAATKIFHRFSGGGMSVLYSDKHALGPSAVFAYPPAELVIDQGDWKVVAAKYRDWFGDHFQTRAIPEWMQHVDTFGSGWFPNPGDSGFTNFTQLADYHYVGNTYDIREWAMYWQCIVRMGHVDSYDHTDGIYDPRSDLGGMTAFAPGIAEVVQIGREVGLYVAGKTVRLDSPLFAASNPQDWYHMDYAGKTIPAGAESIFVCPGYTAWQNQLAAQCQNLIAQTGAKYIRVDEVSFSYEPCYNPAHNHADPYLAASSLELLRVIREAVDQVDPNVVILTENPSEPLSRYCNGALCIWSPGPDMAPLRMTAPGYMGFSYYSGQVEAALQGFICSSSAAGNSGGWATSHHENIWGDGLEDMPDCYSTFGTGDNLIWDELSHIFKDAVFVADCTTVNPQPMGMNSNERENWAGRLWKTDNYWLVTCGNRVAINPPSPVMVKLPELDGRINRAFEFDTKTGTMREVEIIRNTQGIFCSLPSGFSAVFLPLATCPPLVEIDAPALLSRVAANVITLELYAPWLTDVTACTVTVKIPGLTLVGADTFAVPGGFSVSVPTSASSGRYYLQVEGACLPAKIWLQVP